MNKKLINKGIKDEIFGLNIKQGQITIVTQLDKVRTQPTRSLLEIYSRTDI